MTQTISRTQIENRLNAGEPFILVEALPKKYFDDWHLPGAMNIPHDQVEELAPVLLPDKDRFIVVYCASTECQNSRIAANTLTQMGYTQVFEYVEGKKDWLDNNLPVEQAA